MAKKTENDTTASKEKTEKARKTHTATTKSTKPDNRSLDKLYENRAAGLTKSAPGTTPGKAAPKTKTAKRNKKKKDEGVTENAPYSHLARYRMISGSDDVINSSGS